MRSSRTVRRLLAAGAASLLTTATLLTAAQGPASAGTRDASARPAAVAPARPGIPLPKPWPWPFPVRCRLDTLDTLPPGDTVTNVAAPFAYSTPLLDLEAQPFVWSSGTATWDGYALTEAGGMAGGSGTEIRLNNLTLGMRAAGVAQLRSLQVAFGEFGGNLNLTVDGTSAVFDDFADVHGAVLGGVTVTVLSGGTGQDRGVLRLDGPMPDQGGGLGHVAIGGQELWIDDVCYR